MSLDISRTADLMVIAIARALVKGESVFHGLASTIPHIAIQVADRGMQKELNYVNITGGYLMHPETVVTSTDGDNLYNGTTCSFNLTDIFDFAARGRLDTAFFGRRADRSDGTPEQHLYRLVCEAEGQAARRRWKRSARSECASRSGLAHQA